jgi:hypothetical protein
MGTHVLHYVLAAAERFLTNVANERLRGWMRTLVHPQIGGGNELLVARSTCKTLTVVSGHLMIDNSITIRKFQLAKFAFARLQAVANHVSYHFGVTHDFLSTKITNHDQVLDTVRDLIMMDQHMKIKRMVVSKPLVANFTTFELLWIVHSEFV